MVPGVVFHAKHYKDDPGWQTLLMSLLLCFCCQGTIQLPDPKSQPAGASSSQNKQKQPTNRKSLSDNSRNPAKIQPKGDDPELILTPKQVSSV